MRYTHTSLQLVINGINLADCPVPFNDNIEYIVAATINEMFYKGIHDSTY